MATKEGADFPARLYVAFERNRRALCYAWDARRPAGTIMPNFGDVAFRSRPTS